MGEKVNAVLCCSMIANPKIHNIVLVDDDNEIQDMVSAFFKPKNFEVICFTDAEDAIKASSSVGQEWDVLLSDLRFANMTGVEFTIQLKKRLPLLPIIFITPPEAANREHRNRSHSKRGIRFYFQADSFRSAPNCRGKGFAFQGFERRHP
jgi:CheY-like chemotaxis protein